MDILVIRVILVVQSCRSTVHKLLTKSPSYIHIGEGSTEFEFYNRTYRNVSACSCKEFYKRDYLALAHLYF